MQGPEHDVVIIESVQANINSSKQSGQRLSINLQFEGKSTHLPSERRDGTRWNEQTRFFRRYGSCITFTVSKSSWGVSRCIGYGILPLRSLLLSEDRRLRTCCAVFFRDELIGSVTFDLACDIQNRGSTWSSSRQTMTLSRFTDETVPFISQSPQMLFNPHELILDRLVFETPFYIRDRTRLSKAVDQSSGRSLVVKTITCLSDDQFNSANQEAHLMRQMPRHPSLCELYTSLLKTDATEKRLLILMEFIQGQNLEQAICARAGNPWTHSELARHWNSLVVAFAILQEARITHSDVKPTNLMLTPQVTLKIIDFGSAMLLQSPNPSGETFRKAGTPRYFSPRLMQALRNDQVQHNPFKSDVFSLGLTFYEMASLKSNHRLQQAGPRQQTDIQQAIAELELDESLKTLLQHMLVVDEELRPDFIILRNHFFAG